MTRHWGCHLIGLIRFAPRLRSIWFHIQSRFLQDVSDCSIQYNQLFLEEIWLGYSQALDLFTRFCCEVLWRPGWNPLFMIQRIMVIFGKSWATWLWLIYGRVRHKLIQLNLHKANPSISKKRNHYVFGWKSRSSFALDWTLARKVGLQFELMRPHRC